MERDRFLHASFKTYCTGPILTFLDRGANALVEPSGNHFSRFQTNGSLRISGHHGYEWIEVFGILCTSIKILDGGDAYAFVGTVEALFNPFVTGSGVLFRDADRFRRVTQRLAGACRQGYAPFDLPYGVLGLVPRVGVRRRDVAFQNP